MLLGVVLERVVGWLPGVRKRSETRHAPHADARCMNEHTSDRVDHGASPSPGLPRRGNLVILASPLQAREIGSVVRLADAGCDARVDAAPVPQPSGGNRRSTRGGSRLKRRPGASEPEAVDSWNLRADPPGELTRPVPVDPDGRAGPTKGQARGPSWRRTSTGLYVPSAVDRGRVEQRILEEAGRLRGRGAVSGWAALRLHGGGYFDGRGPDGRATLPVPLVVTPGVPLRRAPGIEAHRERLPASEVTERHGISCTTPERAAFDAARWSPDLRTAVVTLDMALAPAVVQLAALRSHLSAKAGWPGVRMVTRALDLVDPRSRSPEETRLRLIWCLDAGLPTPRCNWPVADASGTFIGTPDLLCEELGVVGEFDGAEHRSRRRQRDDVRRDDLFRRVGLESFRVVGADLRDVPLVVDRIRAAVSRAAASRAPRTWRIKRDPGPLR